LTLFRSKDIPEVSNVVVADLFFCLKSIISHHYPFVNLLVISTLMPVNIYHSSKDYAQSSNCSC